jgi:uncharacterized protein YqiB (DUF1249 family)
MLTRVDTQRPQVQRFARQLPNLHATIYAALNLLLPDALARADTLVSSVPASADLYLNVLERHDYTSYVQLTYVFAGSNVQNPNAYIRIYHDAHMAEATAFSPEQGIDRLAGPNLPIHGQVVRSWRLNRALVKWLDYLLDQGHGAATFNPIDEIPEFLSI